MFFFVDIFSFSLNRKPQSKASISSEACKRLLKSHIDVCDVHDGSKKFRDLNTKRTCRYVNGKFEQPVAQERKKKASLENIKKYHMVMNGVIFSITIRQVAK